MINLDVYYSPPSSNGFTLKTQTAPCPDGTVKPGDEWILARIVGSTE